MATCSSCQADVPVGAASCPACGTSAVRAAATTIKFDLSALSHPDKIVGGASVILFISLFLSWFSYNTGFGVYSGSGLSVHGYLYIPLLISIGIIAMMGATALGLWTFPANSPVPRERALLIGTTISVVLVVIGFLSKPGGSGSGVGWSFGAFVGLAAAIVAMLPLARPALAARRGK